MQSSLPPPPPPTEIQYVVQENRLEHPLSPVAEELITLSPELLLGRLNLFEYNKTKHALVITSAFQELLKFLVQIHELHPRILKTSSLFELNELLQQPQDFEGGLLRKAGKERWELKDSPITKKFQERLTTFFQKNGLFTPKSVKLPTSVDSCILFGSYYERMERRVRETLLYLENGLQVNGSIFLLGSIRPLTIDELETIKTKITSLSEPQKTTWKTLFNDPVNQTEAKAFLFIWQTLASPEIQKNMNDKLVSIQSSKNLSSSKQPTARPTTRSTVEDWLDHYQPERPQSIFALVEPPFTRLLDQFQSTVLTNGLKASRQTLLERINNTHFFYAVPETNEHILIRISFDEIARNVHRTVETLHYLESLQ